ncbi:microfibrillar-associated protein MFAP1, Zn finger, CCHC type protein [Hysterangium stoloniferum]|nr:microfibrillar-associated protein MFAP1, Zn finger, CCHC type protein [Hysterangium stoloniferum]
MQPAKKKDAPRLARPLVRYWKGKAPKGIAEMQDSDSDYDETAQETEPGDEPIADLEGDGDEVEDTEEGIPIQTATMRKTMNVALKNVNISKEGKVIVAGKEESGRTLQERGAFPSNRLQWLIKKHIYIEGAEEENEEEEEAELAHDEESGSSEYETDSEEEKIKPASIFRPVFVPKRARVTIAEREAEILETEEAQRKRELEAEERRKQSHDMVAESIKRELAEKETEDHVPDVDDTDDIDPMAEFEAWRLRELGRIKRDKEEQVRREVEREEIERRRALPEEVRLKEDLERAQKTRDEKPKGQQKFLQKYWHKGAFHQDEEILKRHDYTEATESTIDVTLLPKVMQVRDFGKRSRTKYTHLLDQDTTIPSGGFGGTGSVKPTVGQGCFLCGGPHLKKDCPQLASQTGPPGSGANRTAFSGASDAAQGEQRQWGRRDDGDSKSWKDRGRDDIYRKNDRSRRHDFSPRQDSERWRDDYRRHPQSRSHSRGDRPSRRPRTRSPSFDTDSRDREKRRRVD